MEQFTHSQRVLNAIACKPSDRTCYANLDGGLIGRWHDPTFLPGDMYTRPEWAMDTIIEAARKMGGDTCANYIYGPIMAMDYTGIYYKTPGRELVMDTCFQAIETNPLDEDERIDFILENGVQAYIDKFVVPNWPEWAFDEGEKGGMYAGMYAEKCMEAGEEWFNMPIPQNGGAMFYNMSRGYMKYLKDLRRIPEKVKKVSQMFADWELATNEAMWAEMGGLQCIFPAWGRFDNNTLNPRKFDEFVWPVTRSWIDYAADHNKLLVLHADGEYSQTLNKHLCEFTPGNTIIQCDGFTKPDDIAEELVKTRLCFMGDVPASMFTMGTPEDVYNHVIHLKQLFGPGLILYSGCGTPFNTRLENVDAYIEAANTNNY